MVPVTFASQVKPSVSSLPSICCEDVDIIFESCYGTTTFEIRKKELINMSNVRMSQLNLISLPTLELVLARAIRCVHGDFAEIYG